MLGIARAWDRLRGSGAELRPEEAEAARAARVAVGHALRDARWRRKHDEDRFGFHLGPERPLPPRPSVLRGLRPAFIVLAALGLVMIGVLLYRPSAPGGTRVAAPEPQATAGATAPAAAGRGRTSATLAPVVIVPPTAQPTPATPAPVSSVTPGPGAGTGIGAGVLPPLAPADDRFIFAVLDAETTRPLPGVCVVYGTECPSVRLTNAQGLWWIDFPRSSALADRWRFDFVLDGYVRETREIRYVPGEINPVVGVLLRRAR